MQIQINSVFGGLLFEGDFTNLAEAVESHANLSGADLYGADLSDAKLYGANLYGANLSCADLSHANLSNVNLSGANLSGANLSDANLSGANLSYANLFYAKLSGANLYGADLYGKKIHSMRIFSGLYKYTVHAVLFIDGSRWVRMGCLFKSLEEWEKIGIRDSNPSEFPNDGSEKCEERVAVFEFATAAALSMKD